jgi:protease-4
MKLDRAIAAMWAMVFACGLLGGCGPMILAIGVEPGDQKLTTTVVQPGGWFVSDQVAIIEVSGLIHNGRSPGLISEGNNPVSDLTEALQAAKNDDRVKAVILRINSPGGTVTGSDAMYRQVLRFKQQTHKPVVVLMLDVAASGGYYVACAADQIVAYPTTVTGSIGVIVQTITFKPGLDRIGIHAEDFTSGPNKDAGSPLSVLTDSQRQVLRTLVEDYYQRFTTVVRTNRPNIPTDKFAFATDGRVVSGDQALALGLVDHTGDIDDAFALAKSLAHLEKANLVVYHRPLEYVGSPFARSGVGAPAAGGTQVNIAQFNLPGALPGEGAGFYYLWNPGMR